ncbi:MAG: NuoM family protein, partial [bacterium]
MILLLMLTFPLMGALILGIFPFNNRGFNRFIVTLSVSTVFICSLYVWIHYPAGQSGYMDGEFFSLSWTWFTSPFQARFALGVDGISVVFATLTSLLALLSVGYSIVHEHEHERDYFICQLLLLTAMLGVFLARDMVLFYLFWESILIPMYFLIGIWGGNRRVYASLKFVLFTLVGSLLMLVSIVVLYSYQAHQFQNASMLITDFYRISIPDTSVHLLYFGFPVPVGTLLFLSFSLAFAIKTPLFPVHTWLPDAHVEAPTTGSVILAGILLKVGIYGFIRLLIPIFPLQSVAWGATFACLGVLGIIYGGLLAWAQQDIKKLVAYSSISHLGFVILGLFALEQTSVTGGLLQGAIHGINTGALFLMVGMVYERTHNRSIREVGGLADEMPVWSVFFVVFSLASIGLPATNGFVGEFLILSSSFGTYSLLTILGASGVIISAIYMLYLLRRCVFSELTDSVEGISSLSSLEISCLVPL